MFYTGRLENGGILLDKRCPHLEKVSVGMRKDVGAAIKRKRPNGYRLNEDRMIQFRSKKKKNKNLELVLGIPDALV